MKITIGIADDHHIFLKSLSILINSFHHFHVIIHATSAAEILEKFKSQKLLPEILMLDATIPKEDCIATAINLKEKFPKMKLVALYLNEIKELLEAMFKAGCIAAIRKDAHPDQLEKVLLEVYEGSYTLPNSITESTSE